MIIMDTDSTIEDVLKENDYDVFYFMSGKRASLGLEQ